MIYLGWMAHTRWFIWDSWLICDGLSGMERFTWDGMGSYIA